MDRVSPAVQNIAIYSTRFPFKKILFGLWRSYFHYPDNLQYFNGYALFIVRAVGYEPVT